MILVKKPWFKNKSYGWGWTPATWQGWLILALFVIYIVRDFMQIDARQHSGSDTLINFVPRVVLYVLILVIICTLTGEKPRWSWGKKKK